MANFQRNKQKALKAANEVMSPREQVARLQAEVADSLKREGANTKVPCPVADQIFDQLYGRLWLQGSVVKEFVAAEDLLNIIKLDYDATLNFYRQRRQNTFRSTVHPEDDQELHELESQVHEAEERLTRLSEQLALLEDRERLEMALWLDKFGMAQLVHSGRVGTLKTLSRNLELRETLLNEKVDVLEQVDELLEWARGALEVKK